MVNLYDLTVRSYLQYLTSAISMLQTAQRQFPEEDEELTQATVHPSMKPLHFQIVAMVHFSESALTAAKTGVLLGPNMELKMTFAGLIEYLIAAREQMAAFKEEDINELESRQVVFQYGNISEDNPYGDVTLPFTTADFFLSYALPNFYFHQSVAYSILRARGVHIGIAHFVGTVITTPSPHIPAAINQLTGDEYL
eukprot:CAMPEP_0172755074 /NCGR_PEP_ID=MMETSP1074-20121228/159203_1 /TAXON_ID=2916 /ORGANISM="Ceratium fusus, Strain PA161109" /LENGTH=195 /DNA_ID=CAMNT_0013588113 /DNA_START=21 /DNA_END=605 /DNA_ORIENTATION=-